RFSRDWSSDVCSSDLVTDTPNVTLNCVLPTEHTVWVGGSNARPFRLEAEELREETTFLGAPGRDKWHTPWGGPPDIRSMSEASRSEERRVGQSGTTRS